MEFINYPIEYDLYSVEEITTIINFLNLIENCYSVGVKNDLFKIEYRKFKNIIKAKSEENNLFKKYKKITGYDGYLCVKEMKKEVSTIKL